MEENIEKRRLWDFAPQIIITALVFVLPLFFVPATLLDSLTAKSGLFVIVFAVAIFIWAINKLKENKIVLSFNLVTLSIFLLFLSYFVSGFFSINSAISFFGRDLAFDSVIIFSLLLLFLFFVMNLFQDKKSALRIILASFASILIVLVLHLLRLVTLDVFPVMNFFFESSSNTVGRWTDLGIFAGIGTIVSLLALETFTLTKGAKITSIVVLVLSLLAMFVVGSQKLWLIIGIFALVFFVYFFSMNKTSSAQSSSSKKIPASSLVTFLIASVFVLGGIFVSPLNQPLTELRNNVFNVSYLEFSPSMSTTGEILKETIKENPIFGAGPGMFDLAWIKNKPAEFNLTDVWNIDFRYGSSFVLTFMIMSGLLGVAAWLFFLGTFLYYGVKSIFKPLSDQTSRFILMSSFLVSLYMWVVAITSVPSFVNMFMTLLFTGIFYASLYREGIIKNKVIDISDKPKYSFFYIFSLVLLLLIVLMSGWYFTGRTYSAINYRQANIALNQNDVDLAELKIISALRLHPTDISFQALADIGMIRLGQILNESENLSEADRGTAFRSVLSTTVQAVQGAIQYAPNNYNNHIKLGEIYESLVSLGDEASYEVAKASYEEARRVNGKNPEITLRLARLEVQAGNNDAARVLIGETLQLKGNYTEAIFLLSQIDVAEGNIEQAITNVEQATLIKPNDPLVYFQLGILRYQNEDFAGASSAFINALNLNPQYDNARYFLGLSFDRADQTNEAVIQFQILAERYPENEEIAFILSNLLSGNSAFFGVEEPLDDTPENREELPIEEDVEQQEEELPIDEETPEVLPADETTEDEN